MACGFPVGDADRDEDGDGDVVGEAAECAAESTRGRDPTSGITISKPANSYFHEGLLGGSTDAGIGQPRQAVGDT